MKSAETRGGYDNDLIADQSHLSAIGPRATPEPSFAGEHCIPDNYTPVHFAERKSLTPTPDISRVAKIL